MVALFLVLKADDPAVRVALREFLRADVRAPFEALDGGNLLLQRGEFLLNLFDLLAGGRGFEFKVHDVIHGAFGGCGHDKGEADKEGEDGFHAGVFFSFLRKRQVEETRAGSGGRSICWD